MATRRQQIIDAAAGLFAAQGFHGVSVHEIGSACGISGPALYRHFSSKDALLAEVLRCIGRQLLDGARVRLEAATPSEERLGVLIAWHAEFAATHPAFLIVLEREWSNLDGAGRAGVHQLQLAYVDLWVEALLALRDDLDRPTAHAAVQTAFGLLGSTPHRLRLDEASMRSLRIRMARGALLS